MTTTLLYTVAALSLVGAAYCFRRAFRQASEPMTVGWIHVTAVEADGLQEVGT